MEKCKAKALILISCLVALTGTCETNLIVRYQLVPLGDTMLRIDTVSGDTWILEERATFTRTYNAKITVRGWVTVPEGETAIFNALTWKADKMDEIFLRAQELKLAATNSVPIQPRK